MKTMSDVLGHENQIIREFGEIAYRYKTKLDSNLITEEQFNELIEDLKSKKIIEAEMQSLEAKQLIADAIEIVSTIRNWSPF
jgi:hypothetical protein